MAGPDYGALGASFKATRVMQGICLITIIGMTGNFIQEIVSSQQSTPTVLIGTISVASISVIYCIITSILYLDNILPFLIVAISDSLGLVAAIVVAVAIGQPLSYLNCQAIGSGDDISSAYGFVNSLGANVGKDFGAWVGTTRSICLEAKAIWGLSIALCILFSFSAICSVCLWRRKPVLAKGEA